MRTAPFLVNLSYAAFYGFALYFDYERIKQFSHVLPVPSNQLSKFVWLTMINLVIQFVYHTVGSILALTAKPNGADCWFRKGFHFLATALVFPVAATVVILFWGLVLFDPSTLMTEEAKIMLSVAWYNHALHTIPLFGMIVDFFVWKHPQPSITSAVKVIVAFVAFYLTNVHLFHYFTDFWAYPILGQLDTIQRAIFFAGCIGVILINFFIGYTLNSYIGPAKRATPKPRKKRN
uniref:FAR-17a/AIG1-like protein n=1 Tax=Panagrellus redivivus TaxID=6233 RepID=A0A7E4WCD7_PANRE